MSAAAVSAGASFENTIYTVPLPRSYELELQRLTDYKFTLGDARAVGDLISFASKSDKHTADEKVGTIVPVVGVHCKGLTLLLVARSATCAT